MFFCALIIFSESLSRYKSLDKMYICSELKDRIEIENDIPLADSDVIDFYNKSK